MNPKIFLRKIYARCLHALRRAQKNFLSPARAVTPFGGNCARGGKEKAKFYQYYALKNSPAIRLLPQSPPPSSPVINSFYTKCGRGINPLPHFGADDRT